VTASIIWIDQVDPATAATVAGAKMGRLSELHHAGVCVPPGFSVTIGAYLQHCAQSGLDDFIESVLGGLGADPGTEQVEQASRDIRAEFGQRPMPVELAGEIAAAYDDLCLRCVEVNVPTAVRSSATGEDSDEASFAGIFDTYLGVSGQGRILDSVRACWGSLFTARALDYRRRRGISHHAMPIAVGVIELIHARASGVAFSIHPVTGKSDRIVVECNWGWGEAVVQGLVTPDHVEIGKSDGRVLRYDVAAKKVVSAFDYAAGRVVETEMPARLVDRRVLDEEQAMAVADAVRAIEQHYGFPVDVEWVLDRHRRTGEPICIVQVRPVTAVKPAAPPPTAWNPVSAAAKYAFHRPA
jgi:pyruvate, water dikinase